jgi:hypothetical protein
MDGPLNFYDHLLHRFIWAAKNMGKTVRGWPRMRMTMFIKKEFINSEINMLLPQLDYEVL